MRYFKILGFFCNNAVGVLHEMLHFKACEITKRQGISPSQFKVTRGWVNLFMKRNGLSLTRRTSLSQGQDYSISQIFTQT
jgi:hypothetical protein